jgi:AraC-like DNA-binding protein
MCEEARASHARIKATSGVLAAMTGSPPLDDRSAPEYTLVRKFPRDGSRLPVARFGATVSDAIVAPTSWPHGNSVLMLRPLSTLLGRFGVDPERFLADVGVTPDAPVDSFIPNTRVDCALDAIAAARGDETFGLTLAGEAMARPPVGLFAHTMWLGATVRDALVQAARFYPVITRRATLALEVAAGGDGADFTQRLLDGARRGRILTDYWFATLVLRARAVAGDAFRVRAMRFAHRARSAAPYEALFQAPVTFDASDGEDDALTLDAATLALPLSTADPFTAAFLEAQLVRLDSGGAPGLERVKAAVRAEIGAGRPSVTSIARRLGVGGRALRRQLETAHVSLRTLVAAAQRAYATERLAHGASVKELAFELGFSEPSAFSRAYKRWTGSAPSSAARGSG